MIDRKVMIVYCWIVFTFGICCGAAITYLTVRGKIERGAACQTDLVQSQNDLRKLRVEVNQLSGTTTIYEWQPEQIAMMHGLVNLAAGNGTLGNYVARWIIPVRIQPRLNAPIAGTPAEFTWTDSANHSYGPFVIH